MRIDDSHQLLGVSRYASREAVRRAFRLRLLAVHPDRNPLDSLATERTRRIIEAYHVLSRPLDSARCSPAPPSAREARLAYRGGRASQFPNRALRTLTETALMALMAWVVLSFVHGVFGDAQPVYRPDPAALSSRVESRAIPAIVEPSIHECIEWYWARQYQWTLAGDWATREIVRAYEEAARTAEARQESAKAEFYRSALSAIDGSQRAMLL